MQVVYHRKKGFNVNSSSTHCLVLFEDGYKSRDTVDIVSSYHDGVPFFGWEMFTAYDFENKVRYLTSIVNDNFVKYYDSEYRDEECRTEERWKLLLDTVQEFMGKEAKKVIEDDGRVCGIDHQSTIHFPRDYYTDSPSIEFAKDFCTYILQNNFAFLGGNDNGGDVPTKEVVQRGVRFDIGSYQGIFSMKCVKHKKNGIWCFFNEGSGETIILDMNKKIPKTQKELEEMFVFERETRRSDWGGNEENVKTFVLSNDASKSDYPISIDLKINNYCPYECTYCHESSNLQGKHGDYEQIKDIIKSLSWMGTFEVAIGGGEPTLHPKFLDILQFCRKQRVICNFTTRNVKFIEKHAGTISKLVGKVAISVDVKNDNDVENVKDIISRMKDVNFNKYCLQLVMGTIEEEYFQKFVSVCNEARQDISLLGFKDYGFGKEFKNSPMYKEYREWWVKIIDEHYVTTYVDTVLYNQTKKSVWNMKLREGQYTCYIDAVEGDVAKSSFSSEKFPLPKEKIKKTFMEKFGNIYSQF